MLAPGLWSAFVPIAVQGQSCPGAVEVPEGRLNRLLGHPLVAVPPHQGVGLTGPDSVDLSEMRLRVGLIDLRRDEVQSISAVEPAVCESLKLWVSAQPHLPEDYQMAFARARDRLVVFVWKPSAGIRIGWYADTFLAVLSQDYQLIEKAH